MSFNHFIIFLFAIILPTALGDDEAPVLARRCPTMGLTSYVLVTVTPRMNLDTFIETLQFYARIVRYHNIKHRLFFGTATVEPTSDDLHPLIDDWLRSGQAQEYLSNATVTDSSDIQAGYDSVTATVSAIYSRIAADNRDSATAAQKKLLVVLGDYVNVALANFLKDEPDVNSLRMFVYQGLEQIKMTDYFNCYTFPIIGGSEEIIDLVFAPMGYLYNYSLDVFRAMTGGPACMPLANTIRSSFVQIVYPRLRDNTLEELTIPWLGDQTIPFGVSCLNSITFTNVTSTDDCSLTSRLVEEITNSLDPPNATIAFSVVLTDNVECLYDALAYLNFTVANTSRLSIFVADNKTIEAYTALSLPLTDMNFLASDLDNQIIVNDSSWLLGGNSTSCTLCRDFIEMTPLTRAKPYHPPKSLHVALDDLIYVTVIASFVVLIIGGCIYRHAKRRYLEQMELFNESILLGPPPIKTIKECPRVGRLPWEVKPERVHIDMEFLLGEGTCSNVYLGKLKGKAPLLQWVQLLEMQQFQDCAVAVRVPKQFEEAEETHLLREINAIKRLKYHANIAVFLGWTTHNNVICSLLELAHSNLLIYLKQIRATVPATSLKEHAGLVPQRHLLQIVWQLCEALDYLHSHRLLHRDVAARNALVTTGLRAKLSGFAFCSDFDDQHFKDADSLPVRWKSPEAVQGKFSTKSDVYAFGVLIYEVFTLGDMPYAELSTNEVLDAIKKRRILVDPKYALNRTCELMSSCFDFYPERRPSFGALRNSFFAVFEHEHENGGFIGDDDL